MPVVGAVGLVALLILTVFSLLLPLGFKLFTIPLAIVAGVIAFLGFYFGDDLTFVTVMVRGRILERRRVTSETGTLR